LSLGLHVSGKAVRLQVEFVGVSPRRRIARAARRIARQGELVAPALVPAGTHRIIFRYRGWRDYPILFAVGAATLVALVYTDIRRARSPGIARRH
jgi:hypothetical protein